MSTDLLTLRIALSSFQGIDCNVLDTMMQAMGSEADIMQATESELKAITGTPRSILSAQARHQALESARAEVRFITDNKIVPRWYRDNDYPTRLLKARHAPPMVYTLGHTDLNSLRFVGIVGTRHATAYGTGITSSIVRELALKVSDIAIVSGLAYGIDIAAHRAALDADIPTIGILGHGLSRMYPSAHRDTARRMVQSHGMLLTDYRHDSPVSSYNFLARNRLVAALSDILIVVESAARGGALSTARLAANCGTTVAAVPGRVSDNYSAGCNDLITTGNARCIRCADDIISLMSWPTLTSHDSADTDTAQCPTSQLTADERAILYHLLTAPGCDNDTLVNLTGLSASHTMTLLIGLEMQGIIALEPGNRYQVTKTIDPNSLL